MKEVRSILAIFAMCALYACGGGTDLTVASNQADSNPAKATALSIASPSAVIFSKSKTSYSIQPTATGFWVTDLVGNDGITDVSATARLRFSDISVALDSAGIAGKAYRIYKAAFNRAPDVAGLGYWISVMDGGADLVTVASGFVWSAEFQALYGTNPTNAQIVDKLYQNVLGRQGDPGGIVYWVSVLDNKTGTLAQVLAGFSESPENVGALSASIQNGIAYREPGVTYVTTNLPLMIDSLGRQVAEYDFGGGDAGAAGADGSAGDGKPIPNAVVTVRDNASHSVIAITDSLGYYRVSVKGLTPPFIAKVVRADGSAWYSPSIAPVKVRGFVTMNITGLTDKLASDVATAAGVSGGAAQLTPAKLAANTVALQTAKTNLNTQLAAKITAAGLNPATFDPVITPYKAVVADSYDKLLESVVITKDASGLTSVSSTASSIPGTWVGTYSNTGAGAGTGTMTLTFNQTGTAVTGGGTVCDGGNSGCGTATVISATASSSSSFGGVMSMVGGACTSISNFSASVTGSQMTSTHSSSNCSGVPFTGTWTVQKQ
jgi:hypothetical protein